LTMFSLRETAPVVALAQALLLGLMLYGPDETTARENIQSVTGRRQDGSASYLGITRRNCNLSATIPALILSLLRY